MPEIRPEVETFAKIKVIGIGGSGGSAVNRMIDCGIKGVEFIAINTDVQALHYNKASKKIHIGKNITRGLGAGMNPELGRQAAEEATKELQDVLRDANMVFITCGMGGGTGTGASPVVAQIARDLGALTIAVVTKPFAFEGKQRANIADRGLADLTEKVDAIIVIHNEKILQIVDKRTGLLDAFMQVDDILRQGVQGISDIVSVPAMINVDFNDIKAIMSEAGSALMGIGRAGGDNRAAEAAKQAINSPLLEMSIEGAKGVLFTIFGGKDLAMIDVQEAAKVITASVDDEAKIIFGAGIDESLKDEVKITVVATGFDSLRPIGLAGMSAISKPLAINNLEERRYAPSPFIEDKQTEAQKEVEARPKSSPVAQAQFEPAKKKPAILAEEEPVEEDELGIPAFIRKKMM